MGQPRGPQRRFTRRNNTQRGAPNDDILVTVRGQPQRNNGRNSSNSGESRRNGRGHAAIPSKTPKSTGGFFHRRSHKEGPKSASTDQFREKRDWEAIKASFGQYWFNLRNRLHVLEDCLLIDERVVIPTKLRQTVLDSLHLTHPGSAVCWV